MSDLRARLFRIDVAPRLGPDGEAEAVRRLEAGEAFGPIARDFRTTADVIELLDARRRGKYGGPAPRAVPVHTDRVAIAAVRRKLLAGLSQELAARAVGVSRKAVQRIAKADRDGGGAA